MTPARFEQARQHMIDSQLRPNEVNDERLLAAIKTVPRECFLPKSRRMVAYVDEDLSLGFFEEAGHSHERYLMEPMVFARLLLAADVKASDVVLDIGCATGYSAAVFGQLAQSVVALEAVGELADMAEKKLSEQNAHNVVLVRGALQDGFPSQAPFDVIAIEGAVDEIPEALTAQLADGGRLICVKRRGSVGRAHMVTRQNGQLAMRDLFDAHIPLLSAFSAKKAFVF